MKELCGHCRRPLLYRAGDLEPSCGECRMKPDNCTCQPLAGGAAIVGYDPKDPLALVKKAVKEAGDSELIPGKIAAVIEQMALFGMDTATRLTVRAYLKNNRDLGIGAAQFDSIIAAAAKALKRARHVSSPSHPSADDAHLHTPPEWGSDQDILSRMVRTLRVCMGLRGENRNAKLTYLAVTSRLLDKQVNIVIKGLSSSGKSYTVECVVRLFPAEAVYTMTAMSERALIYLDEELSHRTIVLYEAAALREGWEKAEDNQTAYIVRSLLSEGRIEYPTVVRDEDGTMRTVKLVKEGPTNLVTTTTSISLHPENETRMFSLPSNDTAAQTKAVLVGSAQDDESSGPDPDLSDWHDYQRWLATANRRVTIPYATCIAGQIPPVSVRLRRDWNAVRALIRTHAVMHQLNRQTDSSGRIIATLADYDAVRSLVSDLVAEGIGSTVPATVRETVELVCALTDPHDEHPPPHQDGVTVAVIAGMLKLERSAASRRISTAASRGYIQNLEDKKGRPGRWVGAEPLPDDVVVLPPKEDVCTGPCTHAPDDEPADQDCYCTGVCRCADRADPTEGEGYMSAPGAGTPEPPFAAHPSAGDAHLHTPRRTKEKATA